MPLDRPILLRGKPAYPAFFCSRVFTPDTLAPREFVVDLDEVVVA
jgi:hypothetical protein